jgi:hypothetical protein
MGEVRFLKRDACIAQAQRLRAVRAFQGFVQDRYHGHAGANKDNFQEAASLPAEQGWSL